MKTEKEMLEEKAPTPKTIKELGKYIEGLVEREHDYGTCVYAMSLAATASFNFVASKLGVTGFQASCADMDILRRTRNLESGFAIVDYNKLLYPQYCDDAHFPSWQKLIEQNKESLATKAKEKLAKSTDSVHPDVLAHWEMLAKR